MYIGPKITGRNILYDTEDIKKKIDELRCNELYNRNQELCDLMDFVIESLDHIREESNKECNCKLLAETTLIEISKKYEKSKN